MTDTKFTPSGLTDSLIDIADNYGIDFAYEQERGIYKDYKDAIEEYHDQIITNYQFEQEKRMTEECVVTLDEVQINDIGIKISGLLIDDVEDIINLVMKTPKEDLNIDDLLDKFAIGVRELIDEHFSN